MMRKVAEIKTQTHTYIIHRYMMTKVYLQLWHLKWTKQNIFTQLQNLCFLYDGKFSGVANISYLRDRKLSCK